MSAFFGIPVGNIMVVLLSLCLGIGAVLAMLALRHRILVALALRNIPRRRAQTWLIVLGLMLSTAVVSSSFATGDTMSYTARSLVADTLGRVDEVVVSFSRGRGARLGPNGLSGLSTFYFDESEYTTLRPKIKALQGVAGVTGAIVEQASLVDRTSRQSKTAVTVIGLPIDYDPAFGRLVTLDGTEMTLGQLGPDEVYVNREGADALGAASGDELQFVFGTDVVMRHLKAVVHNGGPGGQQPVILMPLPSLQHVRGREGEINQIEIANQGDELSGDRWSAAVLLQLRPILIDDAAAGDVLRSVHDPTVRAALERTLPRMRDVQRGKVVQFLAESNTASPTPAFKALLGDRDVLMALGQVGFRLPDRAAGDRLLQALRATAVMVGDDVKHQGLDAANTAGSVITSVFVGLGLFSIASGTLLIFLIFVMLAAERRSEMGIARAIGMQRRHLIEMFLFEGALYDLAAALAGMVVGLAVGFGAVRFLSALLAVVDVRVYFHVETTSLVISFCLGLLLTFATVGVSAWRVSRLNIVAAVHNLPDSGRTSRVWSKRLAAVKRTDSRAEVWRLCLERAIAVPAFVLRSTLFGGPSLALAGLTLIALAGSRVQLLPVRALGTSLAIVGAALCLRSLLSLVGLNAHARDRLCFTLAGIALLGYWASPFNMLQAMYSTDLQAGVELYFLAGLAMVAGGVWAVVYNADAVIMPLAGLLGRVFRITAVVRTAAAYALRQRFRTGMALAMFALVIFTMVVASVLSTATRRAYGDAAIQEGGFDIRGNVPTYSDPIPDIHAALATAPGVKPSDFTAVGALAVIPGEAIDITGDVGVWRSTPLNAADDGFLAGSAMPLAVRAIGYRDDRTVWQALRATPGLAVVDGNALAASQANLTDRTSFALTRVVRGQSTMEPETVWVRSQQGGKPIKLRVIGVLDPRTTLATGLISSNTTFAQGMSIPGSRTFYFRVKPGLDVHQVAMGLGLSFVQNGMQTQVLADELQRIEGVRILLNELIQSYLGLGLVVGVAALGVISTRAVVERRQHIGMLRALGFQRAMVQISFLLETACVAIGGAVLGVALGLQLARSLTGYIAQ